MNIPLIILFVMSLFFTYIIHSQGNKIKRLNINDYFSRIVILDGEPFRILMVQECYSAIGPITLQAIINYEKVMIIEMENADLELNVISVPCNKINYVFGGKVLIISSKDGVVWKRQ